MLTRDEIKYLFYNQTFIYNLFVIKQQNLKLFSLNKIKRYENQQNINVS